MGVRRMFKVVFAFELWSFNIIRVAKSQAELEQRGVRLGNVHDDEDDSERRLSLSESGLELETPSSSF